MYRVLSAASFTTFSATDRLNVFSPSQLLFGRDMILPIKHKVYWVFIRQRNQAQINKYNIRKNNK